MNIVSRVQNILLKPKEEWVAIKGETTTIPQLFMSYAAILAAIPAVAQFIGYALIGVHVPIIGFVRVSIPAALVQAVVGYVVGLAVLYGFGFIINALAPNFSSTQNLTNAVKIAVYSCTPMWVAGILFIVPMLGVLVMLASLYGLYIMYLGFDTPLMETPKDKVAAYCIVSIVVAIVLAVVVFAILSAVVFRPLGGGFRLY